MIAFSVKKIELSFGEKRVLNGIDLVVNKSEKLGIVGPSNSGKSSFLKILAGIYEQSSGVLQFGNQEERPRTGFLFQEGGLFDGLTVLENVMFPLIEGKSGVATSSDADIGTGEAEERSVEVLKRVGLSEAVYKLPSQLSGGMRKRVGIARALVSKPELLLLDDPTGGLDPVTATSIMQLISELEGDSHCTSITVSHDIRRLVPHVDRLVMFSGGGIEGDCLSKDLNSSTPRIMKEFLQTRYSFSDECQTS